MIKIDRIILHTKITELPESGYVRAWDLASTEKERAKDDPDYTSGALSALVTGIDGQDYLYVKDVTCWQWGAQARNNMIVETAKRDGENVPIALECVAGYKDAYETVRQLLKGAGLTRRLIPISGSDLRGDKVSRMTPIEAMAEGNRLHMFQADWTTKAIEQMGEFPNGKHDDIPDSIALSYHVAKSRMGTQRKAGVAKAR